MSDEATCFYVTDESQFYGGGPSGRMMRFTLLPGHHLKLNVSLFFSVKQSSYFKTETNREPVACVIVTAVHLFLCGCVSDASSSSSEVADSKNIFTFKLTIIHLFGSSDREIYIVLFLHLESQ